MSIRSSSAAGIALLALSLAPAVAQQRSSVKVNLSADSPVSLLSADWDDSRSQERGSAVLIQLNTALSLKNTSGRRIRAITWMVQSREATPGGRASVTKASLDVGPNETFPLRVELRLLRPVAPGGGPAVEMSLDGVLFDDLSFYGPNHLDSRRMMTAFEMEARRDRRYLLEVLQAKGPSGLQNEMLEAMARQAETPRIDVQLAHNGRATAAAASGRDVQFAFLRFPDAPVEPMAGMARVVGSEARGPRMEVVNRSRQAVRYLEIGWLVKDGRGREFLAGSVPARADLAPGAKTEILEQNSLRFADAKGAPLVIGAMTGYVSQVEFADGSVWVPSRSAIHDTGISSAEEQRLVNLYRRKGLKPLMDEIRRLAPPR
ncbi:MAG: hypothetical protein R2762_19710 [Bryobacteraceae bacterium]